MPRLIEIHNSEHQSRNRENMHIAHLYQSGGLKGMFAAHEWSALLMEFYPHRPDGVQPLKAVRRRLKEDESGDISVGLPLESISKYMPGVQPEMVEEGHVTIAVPLEAYPQEVMGPSPAEALAAWKERVPMEKKEGKKENHTIYSRPVSFSSIMQRILSYQLETSAPEQNVAFIREIKNMCAQLI